jgi:hypothetical protein
LIEKCVAPLSCFVLVCLYPFNEPKREKLADLLVDIRWAELQALGNGSLAESRSDQADDLALVVGERIGVLHATGFGKGELTRGGVRHFVSKDLRQLCVYG